LACFTVQEDYHLQNFRSSNAVCQPYTPANKEMKENRKADEQERKSSHKRVKRVTALLMGFLL
jgi:hypothetical protein